MNKNRYTIDTDRLINQFVPFYIGGRKLILYLQALMSALQDINDLFVEWAWETRIEALMTSQIFKFEWYLNRKFKKYFLDQTHRISIINDVEYGVPIYWEKENKGAGKDLLLHLESESKGVPFYYRREETQACPCSFIVFTPVIDENKIAPAKYLFMMNYYINKYRIAGKTFLIKYYV